VIDRRYGHENVEVLGVFCEGRAWRGRGDCDNGVVTLSGTVHQQSTREHAVKMAKKSKGVKSVKDAIEIAPAK